MVTEEQIKEKARHSLLLRIDRMYRDGLIQWLSGNHFDLRFQKMYDAEIEIFKSIFGVDS